MSTYSDQKDNVVLIIELFDDLLYNVALILQLAYEAIYICSELFTQRLIHSMGRAHSFDNISNKWAWPMYLTKNRVNENYAHLLDQ